MKKILPLLLLFTGMVNAQIVNIPDANFKAKLIVEGVDANNDGEIQQSEALSTYYLNLSNSAITDLSGIEYFPNLYNLDCSNNLISNLNLTGFANLQMLYCTNNVLTSLNLTGVSSLAWLVCSNNLLTTLNGVSSTVSILKCDHNRLTSFNATNLTNLLELDCSNNRIASFNISGSSNLSSLQCNANLLTSINIDNLPSLISFDCSENRLTALNIANLSELSSIYCRANSELTTVNLSNLPHLQFIDLTGAIDTNNGFAPTGSLTNLTLTNLPELAHLNCSFNKIASLDLNNLTSLYYLDCSYNQLTNLSLVNLPNLNGLTCYVNKLQSLDVTNLSALTTLRCGGGYRLNGQLTNVLQNLSVSGLSNLNRFECFDTLITNLDVTGLTNLEYFYFSGIDNAGVLSNLNVNTLTNLKSLSCLNTALTTLDVSNLIHLEELSCWHSQLTDITLSGLTQLKKLNYSFNYLTNLSLTNLPLLESLDCAGNQLTTLDILNLTNLISLGCSFNQLTTLNLTGLTSLVVLDFSNNNISLPNINGISPNLTSLSCGSNNLSSLDISGFPALEGLYCKQNLLTSLDLSTANNLKYLNCDDNQISNLNLSNLNDLIQLECSKNQLISLNTDNLTNLSVLQCTENQINALDLTNNTQLEILSYSDNPLPNLNVSNLANLRGLSCYDTQTTALDVSNLVNLTYLYCGNNLLQSLDLSNCVNLNSISCPDNNQLTTLFIKNGKEEQMIELNNNFNLRYICADTDQLYALQTYLNSVGMINTVSNSYCSFTPGGNHNTITGITIFDKDNNGCDVTDEVNPFIRLDIYDGVETGSTVTNINGSYNYYTNAGTFTISPNVENPTWFDFSPASANFIFADNDNNISTQDFCIEAVGVHNDIEVVIMPVDFARPGFDATYKIVYKNKGNQMHSGNVVLTFDDSRIDFVSAVPTLNTAALNTLTWNFTNLMPFENRSIFVTLNVNAPTETPAVNNGDILNFTASAPLAGDELPSDNSFSYGQIVVGSYDPNDITCLEGEDVSPLEIGNYLHYVVNFENTGTAAAENIVVRLEIDPNEFDVSSLQVMNASHEVFAEIRNNVAEFRFPNINLQPSAGDPPVNGHGTILFKMKSESTLNPGDLVKNKAGIYFDYNFPIITNDAETTFSLLSNDIFAKDESVVVYPNPAQGKININCSSTIKSVELYDIQGRILEVVDVNTVPTQLDLSAKANGVYFVKVTTEQGKTVEKIIKQ